MIHLTSVSSEQTNIEEWLTKISLFVYTPEPIYTENMNVAKYICREFMDLLYGISEEDLKEAFPEKFI